MKIKITEENQGDRLDKFLTSEYPDKSRSKWQKAVKAGLVLINGKTPTPHCFLKSGDVIEITKDKKRKEKISKGFSLIIVYEDNDLLVINKPAGLTVHPTNDQYPEETLVDLLTKKYPKIKKVGEDPLRPGIVHRLDKEVSGLMVVAKNNESYQNLKEQFQSRSVIKEYLALVHGHLSQLSGIIDFPIEYAANDRSKMAARPKSQGGKTAITEYEVIEEIKSYSLLKVRIRTGRTHQIRVHLNALGYPIVGDHTYVPSKMKVKEIGRLFLHASRLGFTDLNGQELDFKSPLPKDLEEIKANI